MLLINMMFEWSVNGSHIRAVDDTAVPTSSRIERKADSNPKNLGLESLKILLSEKTSKHYYAYNECRLMAWANQPIIPIRYQLR